jgi:elongation factor Ts
MTKKVVVSCVFVPLLALSAAPAGAEEVSRNVAMQAAAMSPYRVKRRRCRCCSYRKRNRNRKDLLRQEGKPENVRQYR